MYGNWRDWYGLGRWRKHRRYQLAREQLCRMCAAEVVDHVKHHEGDWNAFWLGAFVGFAGAGNYSTIHVGGDIVVARAGLTSVAHFVDRPQACARC
jgi:hypothetical protein